MGKEGEGIEEEAREMVSMCWGEVCVCGVPVWGGGGVAVNEGEGGWTGVEVRAREGSGVYLGEGVCVVCACLWWW